MKFITLLRGINVGGNSRVEMKRLKALFEMLGCSHVSTYINSGNVIFESSVGRSVLLGLITKHLSETFSFTIPILIKTQAEMQHIARAVPSEWENDDTHKTDVAYLFEEIDSKKSIDELPINKAVVDVRYTEGAIFWHVERAYYHKSSLSKLVSHPFYKLMTIRNVNTARYLASV